MLISKQLTFYPPKSDENRRCATKKAEVVVNVDAESVGFRAGDVYQTLAAAGKALRRSGNRKGC